MLFGFNIFFFSRKYFVRDILSEGGESNEILGKKCYLAAGHHNFWLGSKPTKNYVGLYESQEGKCLIMIPDLNKSFDCLVISQILWKRNGALQALHVSFLCQKFGKIIFDARIKWAQLSQLISKPSLNTKKKISSSKLISDITRIHLWFIHITSQRGCNIATALTPNHYNMIKGTQSNL